jgi:hypothetical protein
VDGCGLGASLKSCEAALGPAIANNQFPQFASFPSSGVEVRVDDPAKTVAFIVLQYGARPMWSSFVGTDGNGIGRTATVEQVLSAYGVPTRVGDSVVSAYGPVPGAADHTVDYSPLGVSFTFYDGNLYTVKIFPKK